MGHELAVVLQLVVLLRGALLEFLELLLEYLEMCLQHIPVHLWLPLHLVLELVQRCRQHEGYRRFGSCLSTVSILLRVLLPLLLKDFLPHRHGPRSAIFLLERRVGPSAFLGVLLFVRISFGHVNLFLTKLIFI